MGKWFFIKNAKIFKKWIFFKRKNAKNFKKMENIFRENAKIFKNGKIFFKKMITFKKHFFEILAFFLKKIIFLKFYH